MPEPLHCGLQMQAPLLPKLRGYFAEFLNNSSLAHLRILSSSTCVGLRYGHLGLASGFSWQRGISCFSSFASPSHLGLRCADLPTHQPHCLDAVKPTPRSTYPSASPRRSNDPWWYRNVNLLSIAYAFRPRLRPRLTLRGRTFLRKP